MRYRSTGLAIATALFAVASTIPGRAEESSSPPAAAAQAPPAATPATPPVSVPRPSIAPKTTEPASAPVASAPVADDTAPRRHRRYGYRHYRRYAYWEPFPIYWPHVNRHRLFWNRIPWFAF